MSDVEVLRSPRHLPIKEDDNLFLKDNARIAPLLQATEQVVFSDVVIKINHRGKRQERWLLLTDCGLYNIVPKKYKVQRRIGLESIYTVTVSKTSDEFVVHVDGEYDYHFDSGRKDVIISTLQVLNKRLLRMDEIKSRRDLFSPLCKLRLRYVEEGDLKGEVLQKKTARRQSSADHERRRSSLMSLADGSDTDESKSTCDSTDFIDVAAFSARGSVVEEVGVKDFEKQSEIGRGAFGKVVLATKKDTGEPFAMKILSKQQLMQQKQVENTRAERNIMMCLDNPFLMHLRWVFQTKEKLYMVLDYMPGGELMNHLKSKGKIDEDTARIWIAEIAVAIGYLHSQNIVYRDIKPENILLDDEGHVCLTDFGISKVLKDDMRAHTFCGTPEYLAPEVIIESGSKGEGYTMAVDWWGLGVLLYELTVGHPPFEASNVKRMYDMITRSPVKMPDTLTPECKDLIISLLKRDPSQRLGSKNDLEDVKNHPFFNSIDWDKLARKEVHPSWKPRRSTVARSSVSVASAHLRPPAGSVLRPRVVEENQIKGAKSDAFQWFSVQDAKIDDEKKAES